MADQLNSFSITGVAASLAAAMGIEAPAQANPAIDQIVNLVKNGIDGGRVDRVFMYNPDAVAMWLYQKYTALFDNVVKHTALSVPLQTVMPSVTPVCFAVYRRVSGGSRHPEVRKAGHPHRHAVRRADPRGQKAGHHRRSALQPEPHLPRARHGLLYWRHH